MIRVGRHDDGTQRWTDADTDALPGRQLDPETPANEFDRDRARYWSPVGSFGIVYSALWGAERWRGKNSITIDEDAVTVETKARKERIPLSSCAQVVRGEGPRDAVLILELLDGRGIPLPDALYPDGRGVYASQRHLRRISEIQTAINRAIEASHGNIP